MAALRRFFEELDSLTDRQALDIMESQRATLIELYNARHNPATLLSLPVVVLSRGQETTPKIRQMQDEMARLSRNSFHRTVSNSGTQIQMERPETVVSAVNDVVKPIRAGNGILSTF
jgi:hypothetical protein